MKSITIRTNSDELNHFRVPRGCSVRRCVRALRAINSGQDPLGLTETESEFVADVIAKAQQETAS